MNAKFILGWLLLATGLAALLYLLWLWLPFVAYGVGATCAIFAGLIAIGDAMREESVKGLEKRIETGAKKGGGDE